jgi:RNA polymerase sigma-70 factor (ECF subfamily)
VLRVDRQLAWTDLARVLLHGDDTSTLTEDVLRREAARLRKRFQILKEQLYEMGRREGLIVQPERSDG